MTDDESLGQPFDLSPAAAYAGFFPAGALSQARSLDPLPRTT